MWLFPRKGNQIQIVSNFRDVHTLIKRKPYHTIPRIYDIEQKRSGYTPFTKIDLSMQQYYCFELLDDDSKKYIMLITPKGQL